MSEEKSRPDVWAKRLAEEITSIRKAIIFLFILKKFDAKLIKRFFQQEKYSL